MRLLWRHAPDLSVAEAAGAKASLHLPGDHEGIGVADPGSGPFDFSLRARTPLSTATVLQAAVCLGFRRFPNCYIRSRLYALGESLRNPRNPWVVAL